MNTESRGRLRRRTTPADLVELRSLLEDFERRYGVTSDQMIQAPAFRDADGKLVETDDLVTWSSTYARYTTLVQHQ